MTPSAFVVGVGGIEEYGCAARELLLPLLLLLLIVLLIEEKPYFSGEIRIDFD